MFGGFLRYFIHSPVCFCLLHAVLCSSLAVLIRWPWSRFWFVEVKRPSLRSFWWCSSEIHFEVHHTPNCCVYPCPLQWHSSSVSAAWSGLGMQYSFVVETICKISQTCSPLIPQIFSHDNIPIAFDVVRLDIHVSSLLTASDGASSCPCRFPSGFPREGSGVRSSNAKKATPKPINRQAHFSILVVPLSLLPVVCFRCRGNQSNQHYHVDWLYQIYR